MEKKENHSEIIYPRDLVGIIQREFKKNKKRRANIELPPVNHLESLLDAAFWASLSSHELRPIRIGITYCEPEQLLVDVNLRKRNRPIIFRTPRPFSVSEIVQLAPAVDPRQFLIGIRGNKDDDSLMEIWGLVDVGYSWWEAMRGEQMGYIGASPPPASLTVTIMGHGILSVSTQGETLVSIENGKISDYSPYVMRNGPVGEYLGEMAKKFHADVCEAVGRPKWDMSEDEELSDEDYPERFMLDFIERILLRIRDRRHGGAVLIVPDEWNANDTRLKDKLDIKYLMNDTDIWPLLISYMKFYSDYFDTLLPAWDEENITNKMFSKIQVSELEYRDTEDLVRDRANLIATLANIDGAVVITTRLTLLGFGVEIVAQSPNLEKIRVAIDEKGDKGDMKSIVGYGTRHRSAFRFCSSDEKVMAFVVSQDGGVRVIKRVGSDVVLWPNVVDIALA